MTDNGKCKGRVPSRVPEEQLKGETFEDPSMIPEKYAKKLRGKMGS